MTKSERDYFNNIIKYCRSNIDLTSDPNCVAANKRAIRALTEELNKSSHTTVVPR